MPLQAIGTFKKDQKSFTGHLYIPAALVKDSAFPLREGKVEIRIEDDHLVIRQSPDADFTSNSLKNSMKLNKERGE